MREITLIQGDCLKEIRKIHDKSIDLIITDPPYLHTMHGGGKNILAHSCNKVKNDIEFISNDFNYDDCFEQMLRVCKIPNILIFCSNQQISRTMHFFESRGLSTTLLVWNKTNPIPICKGKHVSDLEFIVYARGKGATFNDEVPFTHKKKLFSSASLRSIEKSHPAQKLVSHIQQYIELHSKETDTILDPFMGSGTTGVACVNTNRSFIGIELNEEYFAIAERRIKNTSTQLTLF